MGASKIDEDIKAVARSLIQGNEKRKKRIQDHRESAFDVQTDHAIANALSSSCGDITEYAERKRMQEIIYRSIVYSIPYEYTGKVYCGRRKFYKYRNEFILAVAMNMGMVPHGGMENGKEPMTAAGEERKEE